MTEETPTAVKNISIAMGSTARVSEEIEQQLRRMGVETDRLRRVVEKLGLIDADMKKLVEDYTIAGLKLKAEFDGSFEVYTWFSNTSIGKIDRNCINESGIHQCLNKLLGDKLKIAERLLDQYFLKLISLSIWLKENEEKIAKANRERKTPSKAEKQQNP